MYALIFIYFEGGINVKKRLTRTISVLLAAAIVISFSAVFSIPASAKSDTLYYGYSTEGKTYIDADYGDVNKTLKVGESFDISFDKRISKNGVEYHRIVLIYDDEFFSVTRKQTVNPYNGRCAPCIFTVKAIKPGQTDILAQSWEYHDAVRRYFHNKQRYNITITGGSGTPSTPAVNKAKPSLTVANKGNSLRTQWNAISGASSYQVFYKTASSGWSSTTASGTSYNYQGTPGMLYYFQVIPMFNGTRGTPSNVVSCTYVRNTTLRSTAYNSNGTVTVGWDSAAGANGFAVAKKRPTDKSYTYYYVSGTSFNDRNVVGGAQYVYQIRPYYSNGKSAAYSDWSNSKTITTLFRPTITNINTNNINLLNINWNAIKGAKGYKVAFKRSYDSAWNYRTTNSRYYNVQNPTRGATYQVQVCAISGNLAGAYSAVSSHTVGPALTKPTLNGITDNTSSYLSWNSVNGATGYQIAKKSTDESSYTYFTTTSTERYDYLITKGKTYTYQVRAYSGSTFGPWSNVMTLRPVVDTPTIYTPTYSSNKIRTTWSSVPGAQYYIVSYLWQGDSNWTDINVYTTEFTMSYPKSNSTFNIAVKAVGANGKGSKWSETKHVYT